MGTPPGRERELDAIVGEQIARMRRRLAGSLPREEQEELAALLEDLLRAHPVLSRWAERLVSPPRVVETTEVAVAGLAAGPRSTRARGPVQAGVAPRKPRKLGGAR